jgi:hypothetical protein
MKNGEVTLRKITVDGVSYLTIPDKTGQACTWFLRISDIEWIAPTEEKYLGDDAVIAMMKTTIKVKGEFVDLDWNVSSIIDVIAS